MQAARSCWLRACACNTRGAAKRRCADQQGERSSQEGSHFTLMSFATETTPRTDCATTTARSSLVRPLTKPLSCTRP